MTAQIKMKDKIDHLIINSPFKEPNQYWERDKTQGKFFIKEGRRKAGYVIPSQNQNYQEAGDFIELPLVNKIRPRVKKWQESGYQGVTSITKRLLEFWNEKNADGRPDEFFFCQNEAIETLIWLKEASPSEKVGIDIPKDGGEFERLCTKMATGTGKTYVMAMAIAWQILNKVSYPQDPRFSKYVFIVAPNLTVKSRLSVLHFNHNDNYYEDKKIVPHDLLDKLRRGKILIENWHSLIWDNEETIQKRKTVDKRGVKSNEAYIRDVLGDMAKASNILVINDEAHHAWRQRSEAKQKGVDRDEKKRATCWIQGLDRIHKTRRILSCFDFSATPFIPSGRKSKEDYKEDLFDWIVSDFGLMDAIESGLTKTPRFVVRDDAPIDPDFKSETFKSETSKSRLYHIYNDEHVKKNLSQKKVKPNDVLPDLVRNAYLLLTYDWKDTFKKWSQSQMPTPPVIISIVNSKETANRVKDMFDQNTISVPSEIRQKDKTLLIYSNMDFADLDGRSKKKEQKELKEKVNTVGQVGQSGEQIRHVISVAMLSEGWNCQTVTHIMGLRAFSSQLLCEQIVGRGLRRTSYELNPNGFFDPEYVNVFGIPFSFIPQEESESSIYQPISLKLPIFPDPEKEKYKITWPNVERIDFDLRHDLQVDFDQITPLVISEIRKIADLAPKINGEPDYEKISTIDMEKLFLNDKNVRMQTLIFRTAVNVYNQMNCDWKKKVNQEFIFSKLIHIVEQFLNSDKFQISPQSFLKDKTKKKIATMMGMEKIVKKIFSTINYQNTEKLIPIYRNPKYISTKEACHWRTGKDTRISQKSHINRCVADSTWELPHAEALDKNCYVEAWVKNDHLGFKVPYIHNGNACHYLPDFIIRLVDKSHLILEVKGVKKDRDDSKWEYMKQWIKAVNQDMENDIWNFEVSYDATGQEVHSIIDKVLYSNKKEASLYQERQLKKEAQEIEKEIVASTSAEEKEKSLP